MVTGLDEWLKQATRHLAKDAAGKVRSEISEHFEAALEAALAEGATHEEAEHSALGALGDAKAANRQYRQVLLTSTEARMLRDGNWGTSGLLALVVKVVLLGVPLGMTGIASALFLQGNFALAQDLLMFGIAMLPSLSAPLLPVYTRSRSRVFRFVKWGAMIGAILVVFGPMTLQWSWLLISCLWPVAQAEWTRASIRRKLPIAAWPKHLYL